MAKQVTVSIAAAVSNFKLSRQVAALSRANRGVSWAFLFITWRYLMLRRPSCCILHRFRSFYCCQYFLLIILNTRSVESTFFSVMLQRPINCRGCRSKGVVVQCTSLKICKVDLIRQYNDEDDDDDDDDEK